VDKLKKALESDDAAQIKAATSELEGMFAQAMAAAQAAGVNPEDFASQGAPAGEEAAKGPKKAKGQVIDADAEVVD